MKKPYIRRHAKISTFTVWIVDGNYIRKNIDEEFTNFGQHYKFKFIPENEFWVDKENIPGEEKYFTDNMLVQNRLMAKGMNYKKASDISDLIEKRERKKYEILKLPKKNEKIKKIHKTLLKKYSNKIFVWVVNGRLVRDLFFIDFTEGGHDKVYPFIPEKEIWIDDDVSLKERKFILLHELHERNLMSKGLKYEKAHRKASEIEYFCRNHIASINKKIKEELNRK